MTGGGGVTNNSANGSFEFWREGAALTLNVEKMSSIAWASGPSSIDTSIPGYTNGDAFDKGFDW